MTQVATSGKIVNKCICPYKDILGTVVPAKSDSDVMFCLQSY